MKNWSILADDAKKDSKAMPMKMKTLLKPLQQIPSF
jgi:hypothetical protein